MDVSTDSRRNRSGGQATEFPFRQAGTATARGKVMVGMSASKTKTGIKKVARETDEVGFATGDHVVYPTHGVGKITSIETQEIVGQKLRLLVIQFDKDRMTLRVPISKAKSSGLRRLCTK